MKRKRTLVQQSEIKQQPKRCHQTAVLARAEAGQPVAAGKLAVPHVGYN